MKRHHFSVLPWVSLALCIAILAIWVRSYWAEDFVGRRTTITKSDDPGRKVVGVYSGCGGLCFTNSEISFQPTDNPLGGLSSNETDWNGHFGWYVEPNPPYYPAQVMVGKTFLNRLGFLFDSHVNISSGPLVPGQLRRAKYTNYEVPDWCVLFVLSVLPAIYFGPRISRRIRQDYRTRRNRCPVCNYDMRATPDRCPECGNIAGKNKFISN